MNLPRGVSYHPRQQTLIALDSPATVSIDTTVAGNEGYVVRERSTASVITHLHGDYEEFDQLFHFSRGTSENPALIEMTAVHRGDPRLPNITVVPNLGISEKRGIPRPLSILGSTLGVTCRRGEHTGGIQQVYELQSNGMLVIDRKAGEVELWVGRAGDKMVVPSDCHFALMNLDEHNPLVALDFAGDRRSECDDSLVKRAGPMLLIWYDDLEVVFHLNDLYVNSRDLGAGVLVPEPFVYEHGLTIHLSRISRQDLGTFLYDQFTQNAVLIARFAKLGISIRRAAPDAMLYRRTRHTRESGPPQQYREQMFFSRPLANAVAPGTRVYRFFFEDAPLVGPSRDELPDLSADDIPSGGPVITAGQTLDRPVVIVVEGAGDWVKKAYRKAFIDKIEERRKKGRSTPLFSVFYTDETQWTNGVRPEWVSALEPWEVYLDKANADDALAYLTLRPDAVFVVTPDFTHSAVARHWLDKAPVVFVEKPFDVDVRNVEDLQFSFSRRRKTAIIGLDHYQFYAQPLRQMRHQISERLGNQLTSVEFVLAEQRPIEKGRHRALQHGLSLDLLPHLIALLTYFGDIRTIDEISVPHVWRYNTPDDEISDDAAALTPAELFQNETAAVVEFTFQDRSRSGYRVPCRAVVGKGFSRSAKFLELKSARGPSLRIDLTETPENYAGLYPYDSAFIMDETASDTNTDVVGDPYTIGRKVKVLKQNGVRIAKKLERARYSSLLDDLLNGTELAAFSSLSMMQGSYIVKVLDRIWWAIQQCKPWETHSVGELDPMDQLRSR